MGLQFLNDFFFEFVTLFVILDPVATVPVFLAVTVGLERRRQLLVAFYALGVAFLVLLLFICVGHGLLNALNIPWLRSSLQARWSCCFSARMVLGKVIEDARHARDNDTLQRAVFPLAFPAPGRRS